MSWFKENKKWILMAFAVALAIVFIAAISNLDLVSTDFLAADNTLRSVELPTWVMALIFVILHALKSVILFVSAIMLYVGAGLVFPTWIGILVTYAGLTVSLSIGYFIGYKLGEEKVRKMILKRKKIANFLYGKQENILFLCFISRIIPMSFGLFSAFFGAIKVPYFKYLFMSLLGVSPLMIPIVLAGTAITNPLSAEFLIPFIISLCITLIILAVSKKRNYNAGANK